MESMSQVIKSDVIEKEIVESSEKCEFCGKPYKTTKISVILGGVKRKPHILTEPDCDCLSKCELERKEKEEKERIEQTKAKKLNELFTNSLITPYFRTKVFENLNTTSIVTDCKNYAKNFNPCTSKGIQMIGNIGTGKTTILAAICNELMRKGYKCLFTTFSDLLGRFTSHSNLNAGNITDLLGWLTEFDFVCLDDLGRETYTDKRKEIGFQIIDTLLNFQVVTAFTANPEMIGKIKQIPEMYAALDRLKEMCPIKFEFRGNSLRGKS